MTTRDQIRKWIHIGQDKGATHVIIVCDTFDHEDYPVFVKPGDNVHEKFDQYNLQNMQRVMEVYNLSMNIDAQLTEHRAFNF